MPPLKKFMLDCGPIYAHAFNKDRTQVAVAGVKEIVCIFALQGDQWVLKHELKEHDLRVTSLDWAVNTNKIVTCSADKNAYVWTYENNKWTACLVLTRLNFAATCVKWSPFENKFAVGSSQKVVSVCYYEKENNWWVAKQIKNPICSTVSCLSWHPDNVLLAVGSYDFKARVFSAYVKDVDKKPDPNPWGSRFPMGELIGEYKCTGWITAIGFSPSGCKVCWSTQDSMIHVVDATSDNKKVITYRGKELPHSSIMWISENTFLAAGYDCIPYVYSVNSSQITRTADLNVRTEAKQNVSNAMRMFTDLDRRGKQQNETESTVHKSCITDLRSYHGQSDGVKDFSSVGMDSQLVIWSIKQA